MSAKISQLPAAATLTGAELMESVQSGANVKTTSQDVADLFAPKGSVGLQLLALNALAAGSLLFGVSSGTIGELAIGAEGDVLKTIGGVPTWTPQGTLTGVVTGLGGLATQNAQVIYWDGTTFAIGAATFAIGAESPFVKAFNSFAIGQDTGYAFYQMAPADTPLLTGVVSVVAPAAFTDPGSQYTEMYFSCLGTAGALIEVMRHRADYKQILGHINGLSDKPTYSWAEDGGTGVGLITGAKLGLWAGGTAIMAVGTNYIQSSAAIQVTGGVAAAVPSGAVVDQSTPTTSRFIGFGPDASTVSVVQLFGTSSNASIFTPFFELNASEAKITGDAHVTGNLLLDGVLSGFLGNVLTETSVARLLSAADQGAIIRCTNGSPVTITFPDTLPVGFFCALVQEGAGQITVIGSGSATIKNFSSQFSSAGPDAVISLMSVAAAVATLAGATA